MNLLLDTIRSNQVFKKEFLLPYFEDSIHKVIKIFGQFDYFVSVNLSNLKKVICKFYYLHAAPLELYSKEEYVRGTY